VIAVPAAGQVRPTITGADALALAPIGRRLLSLIYEVLLLAALLWCASLLFSALERETVSTHLRTIFQIYIAAVAGAYFVWQWTHGGQTVPMKTWHLRLVMRDGTPVGTGVAVARYFAAMASALALGLGFVWAAVDRDRQFLHDRLAGTRIIRI
jgi:uncharacterized RDD family membrane protein YckC